MTTTRSPQRTPPRPGTPPPLHAIVGTAGHIDHGKSALVRALTGIETDRLPEERERGISIELGFAHLDLPGLGRAGVVDVPGHERFLRQMLAGAHGFDLVLLVVAADDGVMPQTEEHFDIVHLLGVERAVFVITKCDAVAPARRDEVRDEIEILAAGTSFENAPVLAVSARTGEGIDALREAIAAALSAMTPRSTSGPLRMAVDRSFVLKGHGVVVTGTAMSGSVSLGDELRILPRGLTARVREIQVHGEARDRAGGGERVAINLAGLSRDDVERGDTVTADATLSTTLRLDARVEVRPAAGKALPSHRRVRVHHGTREAMARLDWLDGVAEVPARSSAYAQLVLEEALVAAAGDRFVLRDETASRTLGGGVVLVAQAGRHRRGQGEVTPRLRMLEEGSAPDRLVAMLETAPGATMELAAAATALAMGTQPLAELVAGDPRLEALPNAESPQLLVSAAGLEGRLGSLRTAIESFQREHPELPGIELEHLRGALRPAPDARLFRLLLERLVAGGGFERRGKVACSSGHAAAIAATDSGIAAKLLAELTAAAAMPPSPAELASLLGVDEARVRKVAGVLVERGELVKIAPDLLYARPSLERIEAVLVEYLRKHGEIGAATFRDLIAASRKYGIPLLDWFDRSGLTVRAGDLRRLRRP